MNDSSRVNIFECSEDLVEKILNVFYLKLLFGFNDSVKISFHQLTDQVDVSEDLSNNN
jgi:hypothetical protein